MVSETKEQGDKNEASLVSRLVTTSPLSPIEISDYSASDSRDNQTSKNNKRTRMKAFVLIIYTIFDCVLIAPKPLNRPRYQTPGDT